MAEGVGKTKNLSSEERLKKTKVLQLDRVSISFRRGDARWAYSEQYRDGYNFEETPNGRVQCALPDWLGRFRFAD